MENIIDFSNRANPLGMPQYVREALTRALCENNMPYSQNAFYSLRRTIASRHGAYPGQTLLSQTAGELIYLLGSSSSANSALLPFPCPEYYRAALERAGIKVKLHSLNRKNGFRVQSRELMTAMKDCDIIVLGNPAFPSGLLMPPAELLECLDEWMLRGGWAIIDESAIDFTYGSTTNSVWSGVRREKRAAVIRSFTDLYAMQACPLSYAVGGEEWMSRARSMQFDPCIPPITGSIISAMDERIQAFRGETVTCVKDLMSSFSGRLRRINGIHPLSTDTNWVLCRMDEQRESRPMCNAHELAALLAEKGIIIRPCIDSFHFTLALKTMLENDRLIKTTRDILMPRSVSAARAPRPLGARRL